MKIIFLYILCFGSVIKCQSQETYVSLKGGYDSLYSAIKEQTVLPESCKNTGKVYVKFDVNINGDTENVRLFRGICTYADSVAIEVVKRLKYFPATENGKALKTSQYLPIYFTRRE